MIYDLKLSRTRKNSWKDKKCTNNQFFEYFAEKDSLCSRKMQEKAKMSMYLVLDHRKEPKEQPCKI